MGTSTCMMEKIKYSSSNLLHCCTIVTHIVSMTFNTVVFSYVIKETAAKRGVLSTLFIVSAIKSDSGIFMCIATNPFGRADRVVHLQVQGEYTMF